METVLELVKPLFEMYAHMLPMGVVGVLAFIGTCRVVIKPALSLAYTIASLTKSEKDDLMVKKIEEGKTLKCIQYILDWIFSLKLPKKEQK